MGYVRTVTYVLPYSKIEELQSGTDMFMRLVPAHKLIAQESNGMLDTGVWVTQHQDGTIQIVSYTEWYSLEDLHAFYNDPDVRHHEAVITESANGKPDILVYEVIG